MFDCVKQYIIKKLMEEISSLGAADLELVAENAISCLESRRLIHRGINKDYKPVKSTIDAFSDDSKIAVECSTDRNYFVDTSTSKSTIPRFEKVENDINHARSHLPPNGPDKIYLITSQEEPPSFRSQINQTQIWATWSHKVIIYDARELAKLIYEQSIQNAEFSRFYTQAFPGFSTNLDNYEYYGKIPAKCDNHVNNLDSIKAIHKFLQTAQSICVLHGLSGSGKTQLAIEYCNTYHTQYENVIWIDGFDWKKGASLASIQRSRGGRPINVAGLFNASKTLLIIDDLSYNYEISIFDELKNGFSKGGKIIITSQTGLTKPEYFQIPALPISCALKILEETNESISELGKKVIALCVYSPIILSIIRNISVSQAISKEQLYADVLQSPTAITDDGGKSIIGSIISKLEPQAQSALKKIASTGISTHDCDFLTHFIGAFNRSSLQKLSFLVPTAAPGIVKTHDLLLNALNENSNRKTLIDSIEKYIELNKGEMRTCILREIQICYEKLHEEYQERKSLVPDWLAYALLQIEGDIKIQISLIIKNITIDPNMPLAAIMSIIDSRESHSYHLSSEDRNKYYGACAEEYQKLSESTPDENARLIFLHHAGKSLRRIGAQDAALKTFNSILTYKPDSYATLGQIIKMGANTRAPAHIKTSGKDAISKLIEAILKRNYQIPMRVALAAISDLRNYREIKNAISKDTLAIEAIAEWIALSGIEGFDQFYQSFVAFVSLFAYNHSEIAINLADKIPEIFDQSPDLVEPIHWINACEGFAIVAHTAKSNARPELYEHLKIAALRFLDRIDTWNELSGFDCRALAKTYLAFEMPEKALIQFSKLKPGESSHWTDYQKAKAELELNRFHDAKDSITSAISSANLDANAKPHLSAYYDISSKCYEQLCDIANSMSELDKAIDAADEKFKLELISRRELMIKKYSK